MSKNNALSAPQWPKESPWVGIGLTWNGSTRDIWLIDADELETIWTATPSLLRPASIKELTLTLVESLIERSGSSFSSLDGFSPFKLSPPSIQSSSLLCLGMMEPGKLLPEGFDSESAADWIDSALRGSFSRIARFGPYPSSEDRINPMGALRWGERIDEARALIDAQEIKSSIAPRTPRDERKSPSI